MASRLDLHTQLEEILSSTNVYYQPPESIKLNYPCILYSLADIDQIHADNLDYLQTRRYELILIDEDPDSEYVDSILHMQTSRFDRSYATSGLNHFVFSLYY